MKVLFVSSELLMMFTSFPLTHPTVDAESSHVVELLRKRQRGGRVTCIHVFTLFHPDEKSVLKQRQMFSSFSCWTNSSFYPFLCSFLCCFTFYMYVCLVLTNFGCSFSPLKRLKLIPHLTVSSKLSDLKSPRPTGHWALFVSRLEACHSSFQTALP